MKITKSQYDFIDGYRKYTNDSPMWKEEMINDHTDSLESINIYKPHERVKSFLNEISFEKLKEILSIWDNISGDIIEVED